jgi:ArsR family transcriptional regulator
MRLRRRRARRSTAAHRAGSRRGIETVRPRISATAKALADPVRVEILQLLRKAEGQVCQCDLQPLFGISQPTLSHHLKKLHAAGLIDVERRGKWAYYAIDEDALGLLRAWVS